jgi:hypothetical protein
MRVIAGSILIRGVMVLVFGGEERGAAGCFCMTASSRKVGCATWVLAGWVFNPRVVALIHTSSHHKWRKCAKAHVCLRIELLGARAIYRGWGSVPGCVQGLGKACEQGLANVMCPDGKGVRAVWRV